MTEAVTVCAEYGNVKAEAATGKTEAVTGKAEAVTGCAEYGNVKAEAATGKAEVVTEKRYVATVAISCCNTFLTELPNIKILLFAVNSHQSTILLSHLWLSPRITVFSHQ